MDRVTTAVAAFSDTANIIGAAVITALTSIFGTHFQVFVLFLVLNVIDFYYGWLKAKRTNTLSSARGADGVCKKVSYWVVIGIAFACANVLKDIGATIGVNLSFLDLLGWFTLAVYILNEITSIVENLVVLGYDVPDIFVRGLHAVKTAVDDAGEKVIPKEDKHGD